MISNGCYMFVKGAGEPEEIYSAIGDEEQKESSASGSCEGNLSPVSTTRVDGPS